MSRPPLPVVFLAFANDRVEPKRYLRNLPDEQRQVREALAQAEQAGLCEVVERANATVVEVLNVFQDPRFRHRVALFHFGGHAGSGVLLFEAPDGAAKAAHAGSFARFLGEQRSLALVFLNGCSTQGQVESLLAAGVPAVVATSEEIPDAVATELSVRFYRALASGKPLRSAFREAVEAVQTRAGEAAHLWNLHVAPGAEEHAERWSLPVAARDPLVGLPELPEMDLPLVPFKHLAPFTRDDAPVFFGRGREIRELFEAATLPDAAPIVLLFGATGAGKSSLLAAGLQPRLEASHEVLYLRRDGLLGLTGTLKRALEGSWRQREERTGKPLLVILDQAEEAWTRPLPGGGEIQELAATLHTLFAVREERPQGRLVLGFRKEWLPEILRLLKAEKLPHTPIEVAHLDQNGVLEAVSGLTSTDRLKRQYRLGVDAELPSLIAVDLLKQREDTVAPILQILLTKMWTTATKESGEAPRFTVDLYRDMERRGLLLDDFLQEQLEVLRTWQPELVDSGLVLDVLAYHTTSLGTAETHQVSEVVERYKHRPEVPALLERCKDLYLLSGAEGPATRLAHDTLAPLVRQRFEASDRPGQRALRILQQRAVNWEEGKTRAPLDEIDLGPVEEGRKGMRARTAAEERLVAASRQEAERRKRQRRGRQIAAVVAVAMILGAAGWAWWKGRQALASEERSRDRERAAVAANLLAGDATQAALVLLEVRRPNSTPTAIDSLEKVLAEPLEIATFANENWGEFASSFSPDGTRVVVAPYQAAQIWNALTGQLVATLRENAGEVKSASLISFSPDGTQLVTSDDKKAQIWSALTGQLNATLAGHTEVILAASFSPDGNRVVTASSDKTARIWDALTGHPGVTLKGHIGEILAASFSPDGTKVVTASMDKTARIWNALTGHQISALMGHTGRVTSASFSPDGTRVVTASADKTGRIWKASTGRLITTLTGHLGEVTVASFSPDGTRVVTASTDKTARIWNALAGQQISALMGHTSRVTSASFSPDGTRVVTSGDETARIWNALTGQQISILKGHTNEVTFASFSPDGTRVMTASMDKTARIWNALIGQPVVTLSGHNYSVTAASFSPDGTRVVTTSEDATDRIWNALTGRPVALFEGDLGPMGTVLAASFSPDGTLVLTASADNTARIWTVPASQPVATLTGHTGEILSASFSRDGKRVVTASADRTARIWNALTGQPTATLTGHADWVTDASFSPDGTRVVTASNDGTARIWNGLTGQPVANLEEGHVGIEVRSASFSPDGTRVVTATSGGMGGSVRIWNALTGQPVLNLNGYTSEAVSASFSPDSTRVATAHSDYAVRIWNAVTGQSIAALNGHTGAVAAVSFSPDGTQVMTASEDTVRLWNAISGQSITSLKGHTDSVEASSFSPDGTRVITASLDGTARIWAVDDEYLQSLIRAQTRLCLESDFRQNTLGETPEEAKAHENACHACVPKFFTRVNGVPPGDAKTYMDAWREYRQCLADRSP